MSLTLSPQQSAALATLQKDAAALATAFATGTPYQVALGQLIGDALAAAFQTVSASRKSSDAALAQLEAMLPTPATPPAAK
jgi:hypothetical protein